MTRKEHASHKLLRRLGANGSYLGFYYTASAIDLVMDSGEPIYQCKWLYGEVAKMYHTTPYCVERNIRTVVDAIWSQGNRELLVEIIPYPANAKPKNAQFIDADGNPNIATQEHADVINFIREMIEAGVCIIAPGGGFHEEAWYGFLNGEGVASVCMPLWYMGRFTDYCPDLAGKMAIYEIPVWNEGDVREVLQGGTGTSVIKYTQHEQLAKDFLAFAKLSPEGNTYEWQILGFDPIRTSLWTDPAITEDPENKYLNYFLTNPFDILVKNGTEGLAAPDIRGGYAATYSVLCSTTYVNAFEISRDMDAMELLEGEQSTIMYF